MVSFPALRRWAAAVCVMTVFGAALVVLASQNPGADALAVPSDADVVETPSFAMFGDGPDRNMVNLIDKNLPTTWNLKAGAEVHVKWSVPLGTEAHGVPVVHGGKIFVATNNYQPRNPAVTDDKGVVMCFKEDTGEFLWQYVSDKLAAGRVNDWPSEGIASTPVVEGDRLWFVSNRCEVVCCGVGGLAAGNRGVTDEKYTSKIDADVIWRLDMIGELGVFPHNLAICSPLIVGDTLFVVTGNGVDEAHKFVPAPDAPSFLAVNKNTGKVIWKDASPGSAIMHGQWSNPAYAEPNGKPMVIFPGGDGWLRGLDPKNGDLLWKFDCNPKDSFYELGPSATRNDFVGTPVIYENKLYIGVGQDPEHARGVGHLWCIDLTKEPKNPDKDLSPAAKPPEKPGGKPQTIFGPKDPANKDSGLVWHFGGDAPAGYEGGPYYFGRTISTCAVHDGLVYAAELNGVLHCLDAETGQEYWRHDLKGWTWSSPYWVDGKVYLGDERGKVTVFQHGKEKKILAVNVCGRGARVEPPVTAAHGVLYVVTRDPCRLWALASK